MKINFWKRVMAVLLVLFFISPIVGDVEVEAISSNYKIQNTQKNKSTKYVLTKKEKTNIKKLIKQMYNYEFDNAFSSKKGKTITLSKKEKARAVAYSLKLDEKNFIGEEDDGSYLIYKIPSSQFKKAALNMFGENLTTKSLPQSDYDIYCLKDGTPVISYCDLEIEIDYVVYSTSITKKSKDTCQVVNKVYYGYWGYNTGESNYKLTYTLKKNSKSTYGYVITKIVVKPIS